MLTLKGSSSDLKWQKFDSLCIPIEDYILKMTMQHFFPWCIYLMFFFFMCLHYK